MRKPAFVDILVKHDGSQNRKRGGIKKRKKILGKPEVLMLKNDAFSSSIVMLYVFLSDNYYLRVLLFALRWWRGGIGDIFREEGGGGCFWWSRIRFTCFNMGYTNFGLLSAVYANDTHFWNNTVTDFETLSILIPLFDCVLWSTRCDAGKTAFIRRLSFIFFLPFSLLIPMPSARSFKKWKNTDNDKKYEWKIWIKDKPNQSGVIKKKFSRVICTKIITVEKNITL